MSKGESVGKTSIHLVPQCDKCGNIFEDLSMTYKMDDSGANAVFEPNVCLWCGNEIYQIFWPTIPLYADSKDGDVVVLRQNKMK